MNKSFWLGATLALVACSGCGSEAASGTAGAAMSGAPSATAAMSATATAKAAPDAAAYHGIKPGNLALAYMTDPKDPGQCGVITAPAAEKDKLDDAKIKEIVAMMKGEIAKSCPTDNIVGACTAFGISVQYYGPQYTKDSAKTDCKGSWAD